MALGEWPWRVYGRAGHPAFRQWSLEAWSDYDHLQVGTSVIPGRGPIERRAAEMGLSRRVRSVVPHFSMAAAMLAETDLLLTVPSGGLDPTAARYNLENRELPFEMPPVGLSVFRSATNGDEAGVRRFLERIQAACSRL